MILGDLLYQKDNTFQQTTTMYQNVQWVKIVSVDINYKEWMAEGKWAFQLNQCFN